MHRTTRSISLTPEGEEFLTYARSIIELADTALGAISHSGSGVAGTLKVTCPHVFGRVVLMPILKALLRSNPALNVELLMTDSVMDIVEEGVDLAIRLAHPKDSGLVAKQLSANPRILCAAPDYIKEFGRPNVLADLQQHDCLTLTQAKHWPFHVGDSVQRLKVDGRLVCCSADGVRTACLQGLGIALMTKWDFAEEIASGEITVIELEDAVPQSLPIWALWPSSKYQPQRVRALIEALQERLSQQ